MDDIFSIESPSSYMHAFAFAGMPYIDPYAQTEMAAKLDLNRIRSGEPKYLIRELFSKKYPGLDIPDKIPMPRPMDQWLSEWAGPSRPEFIRGCAQRLTGDQRWLLFCLESFLNLFEPIV